MRKKKVTVTPEQTAAISEAKGAEKTETKPAVTEKSAASKPTKPNAKKTTAAKAAPARSSQKKAAKKPKPVTIDDISAKLAGIINTAAAEKLSGPVAVDIEVWGWEDGANRHVYIEIINGKITVAPYNYIDRNVEAYISFTDAMAVVEGKLSVKDAFAAGKLNASGDVRSALIFASLF